MSLSILQIESWEPNIFTFVKTALQAVYKACFGKKGYDLIVLEYGIDRPGEMDFLLSINKPHIGVFTAIDAVHSEQFGNPTAIAQEEIKMVQNTREIAFLNRNDHYAQQIEGTLNIDTFWYQTDRDPLTTDIRFSEIKYTHDTSLPVQLKIHVKQDIYLVQTNLLSNPNYAYLGVAITIAEICHLKYTGKILNKQEVLEGGLSFILQPGRANLFAGKYGSILLDSTYNASPLSMRRIIDTTIQLQKALPHAMKIMLILGDMRELGDLTEQEHRLLAAYVQQSADQVVLLGKSMHQYLADELKKIWFSWSKIQLCQSASEVGEWVDQFLKASTDQRICLFKGSQNTIFLEEAVKLLLQDPKDQSSLTRQSQRWLNKKSAALH